MRQPRSSYDLQQWEDLTLCKCNINYYYTSCRNAKYLLVNTRETICLSWPCFLGVTICSITLIAMCYLYISQWNIVLRIKFHTKCCLYWNIVKTVQAMAHLSTRFNNWTIYVTMTYFSWLIDDFFKIPLIYTTKKLGIFQYDSNTNMNTNTNMKVLFWLGSHISIQT